MRLFSVAFFPRVPNQQDIDELIYRLEELKQQNHYGNLMFLSIFYFK